MSPKQWLALLCFYISYLFFGASVFYYIEHSKELENRSTQLQERISINELLLKYASPDDEKIQNKVLDTLSSYCGRPVTNYTLDQYPVDYEWTFFHSFWFSFIVCSTVGYGNSSPHDQPGQAFCILYALIGLPVNAFVLAYLGEFFTKTFTGIYKRYKGHEYAKNNSHFATEKFGMIGLIAMFLGIAFFIFLPACLFTYFENWPYVRSVYYSFVTLTTIGFGDFVPTFQYGQARTFGISFAFYQTFIVFWNFIGVGYFIMIIGFIAKGMRSKRIARLEHQLSMNIKETQHRIWAGFTKDVNFLRRILNEANMMKFRPVYSDSSENNSFHSLPRSSSCPEISVHRNEYLQISRKLSYSDNCSQLRSSFSMTLNRASSDGDLSRIDRKKTFEGSGSLFQNNDFVSNILTALGSIRPIYNEDVQSCLELGMDSGPQVQNESSYEWTWDGSNSQQIKEYIQNKTNKNSFETASVQDDLEMQKSSSKRSFMSDFNPFKDRILSQENRRFSLASQDSNVRKYLENTSNGRESRISLSSQLTCKNMELLESTTIADLIRAMEGNESNTNYSPATPLLGEHKERSKIKIGTTAPAKVVRRRSLRPTHDYTTIFTSQNMNKSSSSNSNRPFSINSTSVTTPKRPRRRIRSTSSSIPTVQEHYSSIQSLPMFYRTMSLRPAPLSKGPPATTANTDAFSQMPMITVQAPNVSKRNILWHPEYQDESTLKNELRRKRADSK